MRMYVARTTACCGWIAKPMASAVTKLRIFCGRGEAEHDERWEAAGVRYNAQYVRSYAHTPRQETTWWMTQFPSPQRVMIWCEWRRCVCILCMFVLRTQPKQVRLCLLHIYASSTVESNLSRARRLTTCVSLFGCVCGSCNLRCVYVYVWTISIVMSRRSNTCRVNVLVDTYMCNCRRMWQRSTHAHWTIVEVDTVFKGKKNIRGCWVSWETSKTIRSC